MPRKITHFVQITPLGWNRFEALQMHNPTSARLWSKLARSIDTQAVVITTAVALSKDLCVSVATVRRHVAYLEDVRALSRFRLPGGLTAYALNPNEAWSGKSTLRSKAPYITGVLGGTQNGEASLRRGAMYLPGLEPVKTAPVKTSSTGCAKRPSARKTRS